MYFLAADSVFHIPLWRHVMTWLGGRPATLANFRRLLRRGSCAVQGAYLGGIAEMYLQVGGGVVVAGLGEHLRPELRQQSRCTCWSG
jgi:hypothetical protein